MSGRGDVRIRCSSCGADISGDRDDCPACGASTRRQEARIAGMVGVLSLLFAAGAAAASLHELVFPLGTLGALFSSLAAITILLRRRRTEGE